jgi:hypothetical protein
MMAQTPDKPNAPTVTPDDATRNLDPDARIEAALSKKTTTDYYELPLKDAIMHLADAFQIPIVLEKKAMFEFGMSDEDPVSLALNDVRLDSALNIILGQLNLTYLVEDGVLKVTPVQTAVDRIQTKVYDLPFPVTSNDQEKDGLIGIIKAIDPYRCEDSHAARFLAGKLVLVSDYQTHRKVKDLLSQLNAAGVLKQIASDDDLLKMLMNPQSGAVPFPLPFLPDHSFLPDH